MKNPFVLEVLNPRAKFCNRVEELAQMERWAHDGTNVLLHSPRRYGKTSLVLRVQDKLRIEGFITVYAHLFGVDSVEDLGNRIATALYRAVHARVSLLEKGKEVLKGAMGFRPAVRLDAQGVSITAEPVQGDPLVRLESVFLEIGQIVEAGKYRVHVVLDEIQEVCRLKAFGAIEGVIRGAIQGQACSYVFPGSRRGVLLAMFNDKKRAFFQSAKNMELPPLPSVEAAGFVCDQYQAAGKVCDLEVATQLVELVQGYPYYVQALAKEVFDLAGDVVCAEDLEEGARRMIDNERFAFEAISSGLTLHQLRLLKALAQEPAGQLFSREFLTRAGLPQSVVQYSLRGLREADLVEDREGEWGVVDPVFAKWLSNL